MTGLQLPPRILQPFTAGLPASVADTDRFGWMLREGDDGAVTVDGRADAFQQAVVVDEISEFDPAGHVLVFGSVVKMERAGG